MDRPRVARGVHAPKGRSQKGGDGERITRGRADTGTHQASRADAFLLVVGVEHRLKLDGIHGGRKCGATSDRDETGRASRSVPWSLNRETRPLRADGSRDESDRGTRARFRAAADPHPPPAIGQRDATRRASPRRLRPRGGVRLRVASKTCDDRKNGFRPKTRTLPSSLPRGSFPERVKGRAFTASLFTSVGQRPPAPPTTEATRGVDPLLAMQVRLARPSRPRADPRRSARAFPRLTATLESPSSASARPGGSQAGALSPRRLRRHGVRQRRAGGRPLTLQGRAWKVLDRTIADLDAALALEVRAHRRAAASSRRDRRCGSRFADRQGAAARPRPVGRRDEIVEYNHTVDARDVILENLTTTRTS